MSNSALVKDCGPSTNYSRLIFRESVESAAFQKRENLHAFPGILRPVGAQGPDPARSDLSSNYFKIYESFTAN